MIRGRARIALALAALSTVWGTQYLVIRLVQADLPPWRAVALRFAVVAILGQVAVTATGARAPRGSRGLRVAMGATQALSMGLLYAGQQRIPSALASVLMATTALLVVAVAHRWLGERMSPRALVAGAAGSGGVAMISGAQWAEGVAAIGVALVLAAALASAISKTIGKAIAELPITILLRDLGVVVAVVGLAATLVLEHDAPWALGAREIAGAAYLGAIASTGANALYFAVLRGVDVSRISYLQLVSASIGLVAGVLVAGEQLGAGALAGTALVLVGATIHASGARAVRAPALTRMEGTSPS